MTDPWQLLADCDTVLAVHAHPDDETLATGALLAELATHGVRVELLTATHGEAGEVVPGVIEDHDQRSLDEVRAAEIDQAAAALGLADRHVLGDGVAVAEGAEPSIYRDSGMTWVREGLAGPDPDAGADAFTKRSPSEALADLAAVIAAVEPDAIISYDDAGSYGHPDHVHTRTVALAAAQAAALPFVEVASKDHDPRFEWRDHPGSLDAVTAALAAYRTQLTVEKNLTEPPSGLLVRHVGGQLQEIWMRTGLRVVT
ncbi:PIG-L family deacetylase [Parenemella sanctibonifatiensis]|uniref:GlcNAc-PI de-N-acetylase n=1 Tax=Parenemella sanctibonifatiensis TaxID=2016505 RepID=A0A255ENQ7_9ACTN|nr:PIG-L family deacetylase [Parenemella sanctibonifatiensis]OYN91225.1 GlcNAc-PI de-N-acetylase [Parenemella sanctibonifatiensis]